MSALKVIAEMSKEGEVTVHVEGENLKATEVLGLWGMAQLHLHENIIASNPTAPLEVEDSIEVVEAEIVE